MEELVMSPLCWLFYLLMTHCHSGALLKDPGRGSEEAVFSFELKRWLVSTFSHF
jgi:hypothetical protein